MALILIERERFSEAVVRLEDILAIAPDLDKIRYYLGAVYEETKEWTRAIDNYSKVPPSSVYFPESVIHTAFLHKKYGQYEQAMKTLVKAIDQREDVPQFYSFYASLLDDKKEYKKAVSMLTAAVEKFPTHTQLHFFLGSMQDRVGNTDGTIAQMKKVLDLEEDHVQALNYLAYTYAELNQNLPEAEEMVRKALSLKPDDAYVLDTLGWILFKKGDNDGALKYLELAYKKQSDEAIIAEHLGDTYYRMQLVDKAVKMYNKAISLESDNAKASKIRSKIASIEERMGEHLRAPASAKEITPSK
jgi:tetratricopeptide (TPR) repeat protein